MRTLFSNRLLAYLIDLFVIVLVIWFFREIVFGGFELPEDISDPIQAAFYFFTLQTSIQETLPSAIFIVAIVYIIIPTFVWKGQTIGKKIVGSKVVNLDGSNVTPVLIIIRTLLQTPLLILIIWYATSFMPSPFTFILFMTTSMIAYGLYVVICGAMVNSREDYSCIHDMVFNTVVVDSSASMADVMQQTEWIKRMMEDESFKLYKSEDEDDDVMTFNKSSFHLVRGYKNFKLIRGSKSYDSSFKVLHRGKEPKRRIIVNKGLTPEIKEEYNNILDKVNKEIMIRSSKSIIAREEKIKKAWDAIEKAKIKKEETMIIARDKRIVVAQQKLERKQKYKEEKIEKYKLKVESDKIKKLEMMYAQDVKDQEKFAKKIAKEKTQVIKIIQKAKIIQEKNEGMTNLKEFKRKENDMKDIKSKRKDIIISRRERKAKKKALKIELRKKNIKPKDKAIKKEMSKKSKLKKEKNQKVKRPRVANIKPKKSPKNRKKSAKKLKKTDKSK